MSQKKRNKSHFFLVFFLFALIFGWNQPAGFAEDSYHMEPAKFLKDYKGLKRVSKKDSLYFYRDRKVDFSDYNSFILEPVTVWTSKKPKKTGLVSQDANRLADYLYTSLYEQLEKRYQAVKHASLKTLRVRAAVVQNKKSRHLLHSHSLVKPIVRDAANLKALTSDTKKFVKEAGIELEIIDSLSGRRLAAMVDRRASGKFLVKKENTWERLMRAYDDFAGRLMKKLSNRSKRLN